MKYVSNTIYVLKLVWKICPGRVAAEFLIRAIEYISWIFYSIIFLKYLLHALETGQDFLLLMIFLISAAAVFGLLSWAEKYFQYSYKPKTDAVIYGTINQMLFDKASQMDLSCYETVEFYNRFTLAMKDAGEKIASVLEISSAVVMGVAASLFSLYYMFEIDHFVIFFVIGPLIGNFVFGKKLNETGYKQEKENVPFQRRMDYVNRTVYLADYAKELRMWPVFYVLRKTYETGYNGVLANIGKYRGTKIRLSVLRNFFTFFVIFQGVTYYALYRALVSHTIVLSDFAVLFSAMDTVAWIFIGLFQNIAAGYQNSLYVANLREFMNCQPDICESQPGLDPESVAAAKRPDIVFRDVSFTYKGQDKPSLSHVSLAIHPGQKIALVGQNGAGKTTFIKLLMRLYDATEGRIDYAGTDIRSLDLPSYRRLFSTAFQDYQVFSMTVAENVLMRRVQDPQDYDTVRSALKRAGIYQKIQSLPNGMDTVLTKEFDPQGAVLSGGELQKVAVARAFARPHAIAVFDEPSSALDPVAEYRLYQSIMEECQDDTVIFISHRLSTAVMADRIYLFEDGRITEAGTHEELMKRNGAYADMYRKQAENYRKGVTV